MTTTSATVGEYVARTHPVTRVGTYTGSPASGHGSYVSGVTEDRPVGRYTQRAEQHTTTDVVRQPRGVSTQNSLPSGSRRTVHGTSS